MNHSDIIKYRDWDSSFFKQDIYYVEPEDINKLSESMWLNFNQAIVQTKIKASEIALCDKAQQLGFTLIESEFMLLKNFSEHQESIPNIQPASKEDWSSVGILVSESFQYSRFRYPWFGSGESSRFYTQWAKNAIMNTFDDVCLIFKEPQNIIKGMISAKKTDKDSARVGIICVDEQYRGQGVGHHLLKAIEQWCYQQGLSRLYIATQGSNQRACSFYLKNNYQLHNLSYWFYKRVSNDSI